MISTLVVVRVTEAAVAVAVAVFVTAPPEPSATWAVSLKVRACPLASLARVQQ